MIVNELMKDDTKREKDVKEFGVDQTNRQVWFQVGGRHFEVSVSFGNGLCSEDNFYL